MSIQVLLDEIKAMPSYKDTGMILCHNGVVRSFSRNGKEVTGIRVEADAEKLGRIVEKYAGRPGITGVRAKINSGSDLKVGDDIMFLVVAGDIRENVIRTLEECLNEIKSTVTTKTEFYA